MTKRLAVAEGPIQACKSQSLNNVLPIQAKNFSCRSAANAACCRKVLKSEFHGSHPDTEASSCEECITYGVFPSDTGHNSDCIKHRCAPARTSDRLFECAPSRTEFDNQCCDKKSASTERDACSARSCRNMEIFNSAKSRRTKRLFGTWSTKNAPLLLFGAVVMFALTASAQSLKAQSVSTDKKSEICSSVDIRNSQETFEKLRGCRVVEGFVQILLFDKTEELSHANISFPELTEITDYLLLYRVNGLKSLGNLFPNLAVIRGQKTFFNFAFVLFEMSQLQEIGLYSLTDIVHGFVRIDKNPSLCYVNTIDWDLITREGKGDDNFIKSNRMENECPGCPGDDGSNELKCPVARNRDLSTGFVTGRHLCWNRHKCQKVCPDHCTRERKTCNGQEHCCNESCLGGCKLLNDCTVCKHLTIGEGDKRRCTTTCPYAFYKFLNRRCVTLTQCINMPRPVEEMEHKYKDKPYKIHNGSCLLDCPTNYAEATAKDANGSEYSICKPCEGSCRKDCPGTNVDSISSAQSLRGCTHIRGSLEIQIRGGRFTVKDLEENLNMIEVIEGYLKVARSYPLISLNFLKNLKEIQGQQMESGKFVLIVLDNQNLQELWDFDNNRTIKINRTGRFFFHFNPKLCLYKIEKLRQIANIEEFSDVDVASSSNGDKIACNVTELQVNVSTIYNEAVVLAWKQFKMDDQRSLLGYVVYSIEAPYKNVTLFDGRDGCGGDGWRVDDVSATSDQVIHLIITELKPYTQYAFYVRTYTIASEVSGAQSPILYFKTKPDVPSIPMKLNVISPHSNEFEIRWEPPSEPKGNVTHYRLNITCSPVSPNDRDYCKEPPTQVPEEDPQVKVEQTTDLNNKTCSCEQNEAKTTSISNRNKEIERLSQINFEDELHNKVYVKRTDIASRKKREIESAKKMYAPQKTTATSSASAHDGSFQTAETSANLRNCTSRSYVVRQTNFVLTDLPHFTTYTIQVQACREREVDDHAKDTCSPASIFTARTLKAEKVDDVKHVRVSVPANQTSGMVRLMWDEPEYPNGIILTYQIEYRRADNANIKPMVECVTRREYLEKKQYILKDLPPGNYSVRVKATSLAGDGGYSPENNFVIEDVRSGHAIEVVIGVISTLVIVCIGVCGYIFVRRRFAPTVPNMKLIASVNPEYVSTAYVPDDWEIPRKKIELLRELGQGSFGMVYEGIARDVVKGKSEMRCAIKTVNEHATDRERIEFLNEASVMKAFDTQHVVRLLGVVSQGQPTLVVMELMANGDLKSYLRSHRPDAESYNPTLNRQPPTLKRILQMAIEIADGMAYLSAKKFVHRDLAARNCMVAEDLTVKIGDFGMTRDIYETDYYRKGTKGLLPVRWMAPESLKDGVFTSNSDVWSYGVVLWEMATLASQPYQGLSNDQVLRYVIDGGIMERPENCPDKLYNLMRVCWQHKPSLRPSFLKLASMLLEDASPNFKQVSFYHSTAGIEARAIYNAAGHDESQNDIHYESIIKCPSRNINTLGERKKSSLNHLFFAAQDDPSTPLRLTKEIEDFSLGSGSEQDSEPEDLEDGVNSDFDDKHVTINFPGFPVASFKGNQKSLDTSGPSLYSYKDHDRSQDTSGPSFGSYSEQQKSLFNVRDRKPSTESLHSGGGRDSLLKDTEDSPSAEATTANGYVGGRPTNSIVKTAR